MLRCAAVMPTGLPYCAPVTTAKSTKCDALQANGVEKAQKEVNISNKRAIQFEEQTGKIEEMDIVVDKNKINANPTPRKRPAEESTDGAGGDKTNGDSDEEIIKSVNSAKRRNLSETMITSTGTTREKQVDEEQKDNTGWDMQVIDRDEEIRNEALDVGTMLPPHAEDNASTWILRDDNNNNANDENEDASFMINHETEYFQLQVPRYDDKDDDSALFPLPDVAIGPELDLDLTPSLANYTPTTTTATTTTTNPVPVVHINSSTGAIAATGSTLPHLASSEKRQSPAAVGNTSSSKDKWPPKVAPPHVGTTFQWITENDDISAPAQDMFLNVVAPNIETKIVSTTTTTGTPVPILPRESKGICGASPPPTNNISHLNKRARAGPSSSPATSNTNNNNSILITTPPYAPTIGMFALDGQQANVSPLGVWGTTTPPHITTTAIPGGATTTTTTPHPMAGPLMFAQGFSPLLNHGAPPFVVPIATTSSDGQHANNNNNNTACAPGVVPNNAILGSNQKRALPADPNTLMRMAQQYWYAAHAAMAAAGNNPVLPQPAPWYTNTNNSNSNHGAPFFANPFNPYYVNRDHITTTTTTTTAREGNNITNSPAERIPPPGASGTTPLPNKKNINPLYLAPPTSRSSPNNNNSGNNNAGNSASSIPVYISDDGNHRIVEQQAPAKLMKHPVLGRLQLATSKQAVQQQQQHNNIILQGPVKSNNKNKKNNNESPGGRSNDNNNKRKRLVWTPELHERFVQSIEAVGIHQAVPKTIVQIMNVEGLTTEHVKSHLQKFRNQLRKNTTSTNISMPAIENNEGNNNNNNILLTPNNNSSNVVAAGLRMIIERMGINNNKGEVRVLPNRNNNNNNEDINNNSINNNKEVGMKQVQYGAMGGSIIGASSSAKVDEENINTIKNSSRMAEDSGDRDEVEGNNNNNSNMGVRMQKRAMDLQLQLQVMVHRTVALQKQLQVSIEKEAQKSNTKYGDASKEEEKGKREGGYHEKIIQGTNNDDDDKKNNNNNTVNLENEIEELDREKEKVMEELGILREQLVSDNKGEGEGES